MTKDSLAIYQSISNDIITMKLKPGDMLKEIEVAKKEVKTEKAVKKTTKKAK